MQRKSLAKVNLFFRGLSKRSDGYHEIFTLMCKVPHLADLISVSLSERDFFSCNKSNLLKDNLVTKSLDLFRKETGLNFSANIHLEKTIPVQAGLGGGSSNAATVLTLLNELQGSPLSKQDLMQLGSKLGSDIPFFFCKHAAVVSGTGEKIQEIVIPNYQIEIHKPDFGLCTKEVYTNTTPQAKPDPETLLNSFLQGTPIPHNDLEAAAYKLRPELLQFRKKLKKSYNFVSMTGSGSAHFVLCKKFATITDFL